MNSRFTSVTKGISAAAVRDAKERRAGWRMPPIGELPAPKLTLSTRIWMGVLRGYLLIAVGLVIVKVIELMLGK